tara:strand:+ start:1677 stop:2114 length:438 start_codon:yes stop_codon:yes gene_type:complete
MLTPELKTNLILKEIGITRYSERKKNLNLVEQNLFYYQKGGVLSILNKSIESLEKSEKELLDAIISSTNISSKDVFSGELNISSTKNLKDFLENKNIDLILIFGELEIKKYIDDKVIVTNQLKELSLNKELKKSLWNSIKNLLHI